MCTVTARRLADGWQVTMNRDEARTRTDGEAPFVWDDAHILAPRDRNAGGTWMGVREDGTWACLLNGYVPAGRPRNDGPMQTRGRLIPQLLAAENPLAEMTPGGLQWTDSFRLWLGVPGGSIQEWFWDRQELWSGRLGEAEWYFVTSSSVDQSKVTELRRGVFDKWQGEGARHDPHGLPTVHCERYGLSPDQAILMDRSYACTQSCIQIISSTSNTQMRYWPRSAMGAAPEASVSLTPRVG